MKFCQVLLAGLFLGGIAWAQCADPCVQVKTAANGGNDTTLDIVFDSGQTAGNANVVHVVLCGNAACSQDTTGCSVAVTDGTNTYTAAVENRDNANFYLGTFTAPNVAAGARTVTITVTEGGGCGAWYVTGLAGEWNGPPTSNIVDQTGKDAQTSTNASVSTSGATTQNDEIVIGVVFSTDTFVDPAAGSGYAASNANTDGNLVEEFKSVSATGVQTADWTHGSVAWLANVITLKDGAVAPATRQPCCLLGVF